MDIESELERLFKTLPPKPEFVRVSEEVQRLMYPDIDYRCTVRDIAQKKIAEGFGK